MRFNTLCKETEQMKKDFKISQDKDIDKLIALENHVKFLNDIAYKTNQSVQTIHMLAPNPSLTYNGRSSFVNPKYLKKAQSKKPCLYMVHYDKDDLANIFAPNSYETLLLEQESRSKLDKEIIKKYDYSYQNSPYELFTLQTQKSLDQLKKANANEFERALKEEMFEDLQYVQSLEKVVDELGSEKAEFLNEYDLLLQECVSIYIMFAILCSFDNIDEQKE
ncbi:hypothetical protein Tco_0224155, partial [Tanacetum coccineum]